VESWTPTLGWHLDPAAETAIAAGNLDVAPQTQVYGSTEPGATRIEIALEAAMGFVGDWFQVGDTVVLDPGGPNEETAHVTGFGSLIFSEPLKHPHGPGEIITFLSGETPTTPPVTPPPTTPPPTGAPPDSAYGLKQSALATLQSIPASTTKKVNMLLDTAADRIIASLASWRWQGYDALNPAYGSVVFNTESKSIRALSWKAFKGNATVMTVIQTLLSADRRLVQVAAAADGNTRHVDHANKRLARADALIAKGKYAKALNAFKNAWLAVRTP
jgi:hypothetical protein